MLACFAPDVVQIDRRKVGGGEIRGDQRIIDFYAAWSSSRRICNPTSFACSTSRRTSTSSVSTCAVTPPRAGEIEVPYLLLARDATS